MKRKQRKGDFGYMAEVANYEHQSSTAVVPEAPRKCQQPESLGPAILAS